jgi:hypothetical protein
MFRAATWATRSQIVRFSKGANEMIARDRSGSKPERQESSVRPNPDFDPTLHSHLESNVALFEVENPGWSIVGVARKEGDDEQIFKLHQSAVVWRGIDDTSKLDPAKGHPVDIPLIPN